MKNRVVSQGTKMIRIWIVKRSGINCCMKLADLPMRKGSSKSLAFIFIFPLARWSKPLCILKLSIRNTSDNGRAYRYYMLR